MNSRFSFLGTVQAELLREILSRRNPSLSERISHTSSVSRSDAEEIMSTISDEITDNLDDDWEPTGRGLIASKVLAQFNKARLSEWPGVGR